MRQYLSTIVPESGEIRRENGELLCLLETSPIILLVCALLQKCLVDDSDLLKLGLYLLELLRSQGFLGLLLASVIH